MTVAVKTIIAGSGMRKIQEEAPERLTAQGAVHDVIIIGAGFSGICAGYHLLKRGCSNFVILEQEDGVGGTWFKNRYPGAACDVPSHFYCFSFSPNPDWSHVYSPQPEIQAYLEKCVQDFNLATHIRLNTTVSSLTFDEDTGLWTVQAEEGQHSTLRAKHVVVGSGGLNTPSVPVFPGLDEFQGEAFHTANWQSDIPLADKNTVVIGSAASAVQAVPELAKVARKLTMFQRTPNYIIPRDDRAYLDKEREKFRHSPLKLRMQRFKFYLRFEYVLSPLFKKNSWIRNRIEKKVKRYIRQSINDPELAQKLVPTYELGCKRILISDDFFPALNRENVEVNTDGIDRIEKDAVIDGCGRRIEADVIVLATGFDLHKQMISIEMIGRNGVSLNARWEKEASAYKGCMVDGFPNVYFVTGPNTGVGSTSVVHMIEAQMHFIMQCIDLAADQKLIEPTNAAVQADNQKTQKDLENTVWAGSCHSWYKDENGRIHTLYPHAARRFRKERRRLRRQDFLITQRKKNRETADVT